MCLKLLALGFAEYFSSSANIVDCLVVLATSAAGLYEAGSGGSSAGSASSSLQAFRIARVFKILQQWFVLASLSFPALPAHSPLCFLLCRKSMARLLAATLKSLNDLKSFTAVLLLFVFIAAILGRQIFQGTMTFDGELARSNFETFGDALLTVFVILSPENCMCRLFVSSLLFFSPGSYCSSLPLFLSCSGNSILVDCIRARGWGGGLFIFVIFFIGNCFILVIFLAILLSNFGKEDEEEAEEAQVGPPTTATAQTAEKVGGPTVAELPPIKKDDNAITTETKRPDPILLPPTTAAVTAPTEHKYDSEVSPPSGSTNALLSYASSSSSLSPSPELSTSPFSVLRISPPITESPTTDEKAVILPIDCETKQQQEEKKSEEKNSEEKKDDGDGEEMDPTNTEFLIRVLSMRSSSPALSSTTATETETTTTTTSSSSSSLSIALPIAESASSSSSTAAITVAGSSGSLFLSTSTASLFDTSHLASSVDSSTGNNASSQPKGELAATPTAVNRSSSNLHSSNGTDKKLDRGDSVQSLSSSSVNSANQSSQDRTKNSSATGSNSSRKQSFSSSQGHNIYLHHLRLNSRQLKQIRKQGSSILLNEQKSANDAMTLHKSLFCLAPDNSFRRVVCQIVNHTYFELALIVVILVSCVLLAVDDVTISTETRQVSSRSSAS
jgi:hypothetical protein